MTLDDQFGPALSKRFYARDTVRVARALLGHVLESRVRGTLTRGRIVEVEAYVGPNDAAAHGYRGRLSTRNADLFGPPGRAYVYFIYGMHWCFNAVTTRVGYPSAVLVRALEPLDGIEAMRRRRGVKHVRALCSGPGKLSQALGITGAVSGTSLQDGRVRILRDRSGRRFPVAVGRRIGITKAADRPLRFWMEGSKFVSR